jgi:hypothetical protein
MDQEVQQPRGFNEWEEINAQFNAQVRSSVLDGICDHFRVERPVSFEPGHVMSWEKYRALEARQNQK